MTKARDLADGVINTSELADGSITTAKLADGDITTAKIADSAISTAKIADGGISTAKLADASITDAKISGMASSKLTGALPAVDGSALTGISAGLPGPRAEIFTSSGTFTVPSGVTAVKVTVVGGGGGSGGVSGYGSATSGGGGGGTAIKWITGLTSGATETVTVGAGGTAGASSAGSGGDGGTSSFGTHCSATGGQGSSGEGNLNAANNNIELGGSGTGGDLNINGGHGSRPADSSNYGWAYPGGGGAPLGQNGFSADYFWNGSTHDDSGRIVHYASPVTRSRNYSVFGGYGGGILYSSQGADDAGGYGCGAGGCSNNDSSPDLAGGTGYQGVVIVEY